MKTKTEFQTVKEAYLEQVKEQQVNERRGSKAFSPKQISKRADTLSKNISEFENMLKQSTNARGQEVSLSDYMKAISDMRSSYLDLMDAIDKVEGMLK